MLRNLTKDRTRNLVRGLGNLWAREIEPSEAAAFSDLGNIKSTVVSQESEMEDIRPEHGLLINRVERTRTVTIASNLQQSSIDEINFLRAAAGKIFPVRYFGKPGPSRFQYFLMDRASIDPTVKLAMVPGERLVPIQMTGHYQDELTFEIPELIVMETGGTIRIRDLQFWIEARSWLNEGSTKVLDISGYSRHGTLGAGYSGVWQTATAPVFWRFDGTDDALDFGNILNDDGSGDFVIEGWIRTPATNATLQEVLSKKALISDNTDGFSIVRAADNTLTFKISDGAASASVASTATLLQNTWKHFSIAVDRNGNATWYVNGSAGGVGSVAAVGDGTTSTSLLIAGNSTAFGQIDLGGLRVYRFAAGGLPAWAAIALEHYTSERAYYGV